jgi:hypothetical protein
MVRGRALMLNHGVGVDRIGQFDSARRRRQRGDRNGAQNKHRQSMKFHPIGPRAMKNVWATITRSSVNRKLKPLIPMRKTALPEPLPAWNLAVH